MSSSGYPQSEENKPVLTSRGLERRLKRHLLKEPQDYLAVTTPGFEHITADELTGINAAVKNRISGGVEFSGGLDLVYLSNLRLRTANRVLMRIGSFTSRSYPELYNKAKRISWELYIGFNKEISFSVSSHNSRLHHSEKISDAVYDAIKEEMGKLGLEVKKSRESSLRFFLRLADDVCTISIDTSGELLYKRGYRREVGHAPIRETTAAALLMESQWEKYPLIVDPLCGSATFMLEAALMACNRAPGINRDFAFSFWPCFNESKWERLKREALQEERKNCRLQLVASDISSDAIRASEENLKNLGLDGAVKLSRQDCLSFKPESEEKGLIISNLPYGKRVGAGMEIREFYRMFGAHLRCYFQGWSYGFVVEDPDFEKIAGLERKKEIRFVNGGLKVRFVQGRIG